MSARIALAPLILAAVAGCFRAPGEPAAVDADAGLADVQGPTQAVAMQPPWADDLGADAGPLGSFGADYLEQLADFDARCHGGVLDGWRKQVWTQLGPTVLGWAHALDAGLARFDPTQAADCLAYIADAGCDSLDFIERAPESPCVEALVGRVALDGGCTADVQCAPPNFCERLTSNAQCAGVCRPYGDASCFIGGGCAYPTVCVQGGAEDYTCHTPMVSLGSYCGYGDWQVQTARCSGGYCDYFEPNPDLPRASGICRAFVALGEPCGWSDACGPKAWCQVDGDGGICMPVKQLAEPCAAQVQVRISPAGAVNQPEPCEPFTICESGRCVSQLGSPLGFRCDDQAGCAQGFCDAETHLCRPFPRAGEPCGMSDDCPLSDAPCAVCGPGYACDDSKLCAPGCGLE